MSNLETLTSIVRKKYYGNTSQVKVAILSAVSALRGRRSSRVNLFFHGPRGCGKTSLVCTVGEILPKFKFHVHATPRGLQHNIDSEPENGVVAIDEAETLRNNTFQMMRTMADLNDVEGTYATVESTTGREFSCSKNFAIWLNAVNLSSDDQLMDRFLTVELKNNDKHQQELRRFRMTPRAISTQDVEVSKRILLQFEEANPQISFPFSWDVSQHLRGRRESLLINLITTYIGLKRMDEGNDIVATKEDFEEAKHILKDAGLLSADNLPTDIKNVLACFEGTNLTHQISRNHIIEKLESREQPMGTRKLVTALDYLEQMDIVSQNPRNGQHGIYTYYLVRPLDTDGDIWIEEVNDGPESGKATSV